MHMALIRKAQDRPWIAKKQRLKIPGLVIFEESFSKKHEQAYKPKCCATGAMKKKEIMNDVDFSSNEMYHQLF